MESIQLEYLNLIAVYMLHALVESQSMGKLLYAFKSANSRISGTWRSSWRNNHAPDGTQQILARVTMA
jgi:hypothetical protein